MTDDAASADPERPAFPPPPRTVTDEEGRAIRYRNAAASVARREVLTSMYQAFGRAGRSQRVPPANRQRLQRWLDRLADGIEVVGWHGDRAVGHGVLLGDDERELALFVHPDYRRAGVGSALLRTLLGRGRSAGVERVWLSVERTNRPAVRLYRGAGFAAVEPGESELEMRRSLRAERTPFDT